MYDDAPASLPLVAAPSTSEVPSSRATKVGALTSIAVTYAAWVLPTNIEGVPAAFAAVKDLPLMAVWAYGVLVFIAAHIERKALWAVAPGLAEPSVNLGGIVADLLPHPTAANVLSTDPVVGGNVLKYLGTDILAVVEEVLPSGQLRVTMQGATFTLSRNKFQWLNAPQRMSR